MTDRRSNAGEHAGSGYFETSRVAEMEAYDSLPAFLRAAIDECFHEYSALQVKQMMQEKEIDPYQMSLIIQDYNSNVRKTQLRELPAGRRKV